ILRGEAPCAKVFENDVALSFMDVFPQMRAHTLVIPKASHARNFLEFETAKVGPYMEAVQRVARAVTAALDPDGVRVMTFNGAPSGQTIYPLHFHILPIFEGAKLKPHASGKMADMGELQELAKQIAAKL